MKKIIKIIFPYKLYLHIFQLERYDIKRSMSWVFSHFWQRKTQNKKPLVNTTKTKIIKLISFSILVFIIVISIILCNLLLGFIIILLLLIQPYILIIISVYSIELLQIFVINKAIKNTHKKIKSLKRVKVIGIAGSYGKTSVKNILYHLMSSNYKVLKTPLSYNTILGISRVVDLELDDSYDFFLCELGEFKKNDVLQMCQMVDVSYGIMTGVNSQHLERFKNIQNTTSAIFELFDYLKKKNKKVVANFENEYISNEIVKREVLSDVISYGNQKSKIFADNIKFSDFGTEFDLVFDSARSRVKTPLLGKAHINNILGACTMAYEVGVPIEIIIKRIETIPKVSHRFEQTLLLDGCLLIDNSYSSNVDSFKEALTILNGLQRKNKILVTPGMVELGKENEKIHLELGKLAKDSCTKVILVGNSSRTESLAKGIGKDKVIFMDDIKDIWKTFYSLGLNPKDSIIILENDLPDNY